MIVPGPLFTQTNTGAPNLLIGFGLSSRIFDVIGSRLFGVKDCYLNGIFRIELPSCLAQYKGRVVDGIQGAVAADFSPANFPTTLSNLNTNAAIIGTNLAPLGIANAQAQIYAVFPTLNDLITDAISAQWPDYPAARFV